MIAVACAAASVHGDALRVGVGVCWTFAVGGIAGHYRARRWFSQTRGGDPQMLRVVTSGRLRSLRYPLLAILVIAARWSPAGWRASLEAAALLASAIGGFNLASAAAAGRWQRGTAHRLLAPAARRPWIPRGRLRAHALEGVVPAPDVRRALLPLLLAGAFVVSSAGLQALAARAQAGPMSGSSTHIDRGLSIEAETLSGSAATVSCWSTADWHAYERRYNQNVGGVTWGGGRIFLSPHVCAWLSWMGSGHWSDDPKNLFWMAESVGVLAHESGHVAEGSSERDAECFALAHLDQAARMLGIDADRARRLAVVFRERVHPTLPAAYTDPC